MYERIKDLRKDADLNQKEFAEKIGLWTTTYARYERGEKEIPLYIAVEIAKYYNVSLDYIAGLIQTPERLDRFRSNKK